MITRSQSNPESDSDRNPVINNGDKNDFKTPMNVRQPSPPTCNTPTSSLSNIAVRTFWSHLNFSSFLGPDGLLENNFGRFFRINTGKRDRIHLGRLGIARLALLIREAVLYPGKVTGNRSYSSIVLSQAELLPTASKT